ncbi:ATP-binding protein [Synergistales bacterium]|nr:ATP-binding protein [Synergistales bacterium]
MDSKSNILTLFDEQSTPEPNSTIKQSEQDDEPRLSSAVVLFSLCHDLGVTAFLSEDFDGVFVRYLCSGHYTIGTIKSLRFAAWLTDKFYIATQNAPNKTDIEKVISLLASEAYKQPKYRIFTRLGHNDGKIYLDLADEDCHVVEIDGGGWRVIGGESAPWFMRSSGMRALPIPERDGSLDELRNFCNVSDDDFVMMVSWLVAACNPRGAYSLLVLSSEHGSGKSTMTTLLQRLVDANTTERLSPPKNADDLFAAGAGRWIIPFDNFGRIDETLSNHLCRLSTGGGYSKRALYTDNDSFSVSMKRPLILNGIALTLSRLDLLDRAYPIHLESIATDERRTERELYSAFERIHAKLLGALLTAVAAALRERDYEPNNLSRMADAETFILQAEKGGGLPWQVGKFKAVLTRREAAKIDEALADDGVAAKILELMENLETWSGTLKELLQFITEGTDEERKYLPQTGKALGRKMEELRPMLRYVGIEFEKRKGTGGVYYVSFTKCEVAIPF